jgi:hypothetical protein
MYIGLQAIYVIFVQFKKQGIVANLCRNPQSTNSTKICLVAAMLFHADITEKQSKQSFLANCCMNMPKNYTFMLYLSFILISNFPHNIELFFTPSAQK